MLIPSCRERFKIFLTSVKDLKSYSMAITVLIASTLEPCRRFLRLKRDLLADS
jgi:hypothetical protein